MRDERRVQPPCKVDMKVMVSPSSILYSNCPSSSQSASFTRTSMPGRTVSSFRNNSGLSCSRLSRSQYRSSWILHTSPVAGLSGSETLCCFCWKENFNWSWPNFSLSLLPYWTIIQLPLQTQESHSSSTKYINICCWSLRSAKYILYSIMYIVYITVLLLIKNECRMIE